MLAGEPRRGSRAKGTGLRGDIIYSPEVGTKIERPMVLL